jgi:hypothetical protein
MIQAEPSPHMQHGPETVFSRNNIDKVRHGVVEEEDGAKRKIEK